MSLFTPGPPVLAGVDEVLRVLTSEALKGLATPVGVSVGPVDRPAGGPRLNWFLYRVEPAAGFVNMEPPQHGWRTRRGHPPLALTLHYLLTADPGELSEGGTEDDVVHAGLSALMSALHENGIFGRKTLLATAPDRTVEDVASALDGLEEPLRISLDPVPFETITALWNSGSHPLRLSVPYQVTLVTVPAQAPFAAGPPVRALRVGVAPSLIPVLTSVVPATVYYGQPLTVQVRGLTDTHRITLQRSVGDPDDSADGRPDPDHTHSTGPWLLAESSTPAGLTVELPNGELVPGPRVLTMTNLAEGLPAGSGHAVVNIVPVVVPLEEPLLPGDLVTLPVRHVTGAGQIFFGATAVPYTVISPTSIEVLVPALPPGSTVAVSIRSGTYSGPTTDLEVAP